MAKKKTSIELKRVNVNLPLELVEKVTEYGIANGLNTTNAYIVLLNQALAQAEAIKSMPVILELLKNASIDTSNLPKLKD